MKVAYLLGSLNRGGTETLLLDVFRNATKNNLDVIGIYRKTGVLESDFLHCGIAMHKLSPEQNKISYLRRLRKLLLYNNVKIVHAQQPIDAFYARIACIGTGIKVLLTFHGYDYSENKIGLLILKNIIHRTDSNIFVSENQRQYYQQKYKLNPRKQIVVYNGIWFDKLAVSHVHNATTSQTPDKVGNLHKELNLSSDTLLLGTVGNFVPGRDQFTICKFLNLLNSKGVDCHFVFIGKQSANNPKLFENCFEYCQQNGLSETVSFLGLRSDVPEILTELDAFIYATDHDTFGIAVVEAMAVGVPVFVNDWGVMTEITEGGKQATLYKTKDEKDLLRQFMLFLQDKTSFVTKANNASTFVRQKYSIEKHIGNLKQLYSEQ